MNVVRSPKACATGWVAAAAALTLLLSACGNSGGPAGHGVNAPGGPNPPPLPPGPVSCPSGGDLSTAAELLPDRLVDEATLAQWQKAMVDLGPRFTGSEAHKRWHQFLISQLKAAGFTVELEPIPLEWWHHRKWSLTLVENGVETQVPVAGYYPYSGDTPEGGIVAEAVDAGLGLPNDLALANVGGKIAFYQEDLLPTKAAIFFATASYVHDPDLTLTPVTDYTRASLSFLSPQEQTSLTVASTLGAVGAVISYGASAENAAGQYTPFLTSPGNSQGVPALYVDRATGNMLKTRIAAGAQLRLELVVDKFPQAETEDIIATLPGSDPSETLIVNTHTDGVSASQENGTIGIVSLARYFGSLPKACRKRSIVIALTPGHFHNGIGGDTARFIDRHPEIIGTSVGSLTLEHLGQTEWVDDSTGFHATGLIEPGAFYGSQNTMQLLIANAVIAEDLRRTFVLRPIGVIYFGVGSPLNARGVPNAAFISGPNMMVSYAANQHLDQINYPRMAKEIRTAVRLLTAMDATDTNTLCLGMPFSQTGEPTGCTPP